MKYVITGTDFHGKRFKAIHCASKAWALAYNIYNGTLWEVGTDGKRKRIKIWYN